MPKPSYKEGHGLPLPWHSKQANSSLAMRPVKLDYVTNTELGHQFSMMPFSSAGQLPLTLQAAFGESAQLPLKKIEAFQRCISAIGEILNSPA